MGETLAFALKPLRLNGVGRDVEHPCFVSVAFNRPLTDDELRFFHEVCQRTVPLMPEPATPPRDRAAGEAR